MDIFKKIELKSQKGKTILDLIQEYSAKASGTPAPVHTPCGGKGICRKCTVNVNGKDLLACTTICEVDDESLTIILPENEGTINIVSKGFLPEFEADKDSGIGLAIDIGTTTIAAYSYDLSTAQCLDTISIKNPQGAFGADVVTRIEKAWNGQGKELQDSILKGIEEILAMLPQKPTKIVITGNTAMLYLLTNTDVSRLATAPFTPEDMLGREVELELFGEQVPVYLERCISAFVGADITSAILSSELSDNSLLVDIGTNGEMAICKDGKILCASTAAGPAFEGAGLSMGMNGSPGAISRVWLDENGEIKYESIGDAEPAGICGSGIIDAIAVLLDMDLIDETGYINYDAGSDYVDEDNELIKIGDSGVHITQSDIRAIQLAKSAICAGLKTLIQHSYAGTGEPSKLYIAGGFGSFINVNNAERIGLIPPGFAEKSIVTGNSAGMGAIMVLLSEQQRENATQIAIKAETIDLSTNAFFTNEYVGGMCFM